MVIYDGFVLAKNKRGFPLFFPPFFSFLFFLQISAEERRLFQAAVSKQRALLGEKDANSRQEERRMQPETIRRALVGARLFMVPEETYSSTD